MKLHLGCGSNIFDGWLNVDEGERPEIAESHEFLRHDLRNPMPLLPNSCDFIYSEHFIEHLTDVEGVKLLCELWRLLKPSGVLRISTPDLQTLSAAYFNRDIFKYVNTGWRPGTACKMMNEGMRLWGHQFLYDAQELQETLYTAGFFQIARVPYRISPFEQLCNLETRPDNGDLIMEAQKPR